MNHVGNENPNELGERFLNGKLFVQGLFDNNGFKEIETLKELKECKAINNVWSDE